MFCAVNATASECLHICSVFRKIRWKSSLFREVFVVKSDTNRQNQKHQLFCENLVKVNTLEMNKIHTRKKN